MENHQYPCDRPPWTLDAAERPQVCDIGIALRAVMHLPPAASPDFDDLLRQIDAATRHH